MRKWLLFKTIRCTVSGSCYKTQLYEAGLLESNQANSTRKILKPILDIAFEHWLYDHDLGIMVKTLTGVR